MDELLYRSQFSKSMHDYVDDMHATGHKYETGSKLLKRLDSFIVENFSDEEHLTKNIVRSWTKKSPYEAQSTQLGRISVVRGFASFLCRTGKKAYIYPPLHHMIERYSYVPYIFTESQISSLLKASDSFQESLASPYRHLIIPAVLRLLYGCGLRISEAMNLHVEDVDFQKGLLYIRGTKFNKERIIPMANFLTKYLENYALIALVIAKEDDWFFPSPYNEHHYNEATMYKHFRSLLWSVGISHTGKGPRLHDLRHTYAVHCLKKWVINEYDINEYLPYLSIYLGHQDLRGTQHYLKLTADLSPDIVERLNKQCSYMIPEVISYERD